MGHLQDRRYGEVRYFSTRLIGTLIEAAEKQADTLHELCSESLNDDTRDPHDSYQAELDETRAAIEAGRAWLAGLAPDPDHHRHDGRAVRRRLLDDPG